MLEQPTSVARASSVAIGLVQGPFRCQCGNGMKALRVRMFSVGLKQAELTGRCPLPRSGPSKTAPWWQLDRILVEKSRFSQNRGGGRAPLPLKTPEEVPPEAGGGPIPSGRRGAGPGGARRGRQRGAVAAAARGAMAAGLEEAFGAAGEFGGGQRRLTAFLVLLQVGEPPGASRSSPRSAPAPGRPRLPPPALRLSRVPSAACGCAAWKEAPCRRGKRLFLISHR